MIEGLDHQGFVVGNLADAIMFYEKNGFKSGSIFNVTEPKSRAVILKDSSGRSLELFELQLKPGQYTDYIKSHLALATNDLERDLQNFLEGDCTLTIPIQEFDDVRYAFVQDSAGNNIELIERIK